MSAVASSCIILPLTACLLPSLLNNLEIDGETILQKSELLLLLVESSRSSVRKNDHGREVVVDIIL